MRELWTLALVTHHALLVPQTAPESYGFSERRLSDTGYEIRYSGPEVTTDNTVESQVAYASRRAGETASDLALWRAADLAVSRGFPAFAVRAADTQVKQAIVGHDYRDNGNPVYDGVHGEALGYETDIYFRPVATLTIELRRDRSRETLDARAVADKMKRQYEDAASGAIAPHTYYYFGPSVIAHSNDAPDRRPATANGPPREGVHLDHAPYAGAAY